MPTQTVLIVEDEPDLRRMFRTALSFAGYDTVEADEAVTALNIVDQRRPDLVILDLMLPTFSGLVVQQEIAAQAHTRNIPIVIVTGSPMNLDHVDVPCVLRKPVSPERLVEVVRSCLQNGASSVRA